MKTLRTLLAIHCLVGSACFATSAAASPLGDTSTQQRPCGTAAGHLAKADEAHGAAAAFRHEAARYRQELQKEKRSIAILQKAPENPWWRKARLHYEPLIEDAEHRAAEAERLAEYHRFRAAELQGR